jgi:uncharacterized hydantoinase/oxoprolinase family protein
MARAYLKICTQAGKERRVASTLRRLSGVKCADLTAGEQDIIVCVEAKTYEALLKMVVGKVRKISGVVSTITNLVLE